MRRALLLAVAFLVSVVALNALAAQPYPTKPIRLVVPFPPGGGTDILGRLIADPVTRAFGQQVVVDNRGGAGGSIGAEIAARAEPDGYTLILVSSSYAASAAYRKLPYDPVNGIQPIILIGTTGLAMSVNPSVPAKSVRELIDYAKANPGKLNFASVGVGSVAHLTFELFKLMTKVNVIHVPYRGGGPALSAIIAGEAQFTFVSIVPTMRHARAGRVRILAVTSPKRSPLLPDVPTVGETLPGFQVIHWYGMWGPKGMPKKIVSMWNKEVAKVLHTSEMKKRLQFEGLEIAAGPPEQFGKILTSAVGKWQKVMKEAHIKQQAM